MVSAVVSALRPQAQPDSNMARDEEFENAYVACIEPDRDDLKSDLMHQKIKRPDDETSSAYKSWESDHAKMAVDLVEKFGLPQDSAYLLWFLHEFGGSQIDIKKYFDQKWVVRHADHYWLRVRMDGFANAFFIQIHSVLQSCVCASLDAL